MAKLLHSILVLCTASLLVLATKVTKNPVCTKGPPAHIDVYDCCKFPKLFMNRTLTECAKENNQEVDTKLDDIENTCQIHCFFNKSKILTNDTAIDEKSLAEHLDMMLIAESDWLQVMPLASEKCLKDLTPDVMEEVLKEMNKESQSANNTVCSPITTLYLDCLLMDLFERCPATKITKSEKCTELKYYLENCEDD